ncbi:hypothetical protein Tco_0560899 [Tanacetum coccineum]
MGRVSLHHSTLSSLTSSSSDSSQFHLWALDASRSKAHSGSSTRVCYSPRCVTLRRYLRATTNQLSVRLLLIIRRLLLLLPPLKYTLYPPTRSRISSRDSLDGDHCIHLHILLVTTSCRVVDLQLILYIITAVMCRIISSLPVIVLLLTSNNDYTRSGITLKQSSKNLVKRSVEESVGCHEATTEAALPMSWRELMKLMTEIDTCPIWNRRFRNGLYSYYVELPQLLKDTPGKRNQGLLKCLELVRDEDIPKDGLFRPLSVTTELQCDMPLGRLEIGLTACPTVFIGLDEVVSIGVNRRSTGLELSKELLFRTRDSKLLVISAPILAFAPKEVKTSRDKAVILTVLLGDEKEFCEQCGVEFVDSQIRRYQMGFATYSRSERVEHETTLMVGAAYSDYDILASVVITRESRLLVVMR